MSRALERSGWEGRPFKAVLVKGRGNYVSIRRLRLASSRQDKLFADAASRRSLHVIEDWGYQTEDGTLSTLPSLERPGVWDRVQSDSGNCMGRKCPHHNECFYQTARREMEDANLLVCNHALFFSDLALRAQQAGFLPSYDHVVLDEAHMVEEVAGEHFGRSLAEGRVRHLLSSLYHERTRKGFLANLSLSSGDTEPVDRAVRLVMDAGEAAGDFFESVEALTRSDAHDAGQRRSPSTSARVRTPGAIDNPLSDPMNRLVQRLRLLKDDASTDADRFELNAYAQRAAAIADDAEALVVQSLPGCAYWTEVSSAGQGGSRLRVGMACSPIDVAPVLREHLFGDDGPSVVLTSATLATRSPSEDEPAEHREAAFTHVIERLGCDGARTLQLGSPFDHARQVELFVDVSMDSPAGAGGASLGYYDALVARVLDHLVATDGGAFVLFTSFAALNAVADRLAAPLESLDMPLLAQGRDGPRGELLRRFREHDRSVLLGAASFWQGVDVRGEALRNVIITKLPFDPPDRPLTEARTERIRDRGGDPFREEALPRAVIRFKQGFGRLIRSGDDRGRVAVLDPRVVTKSYGRAFLAALPEGVEPHVLRE
ncbi:MAG: helicase C-terminal domain-containing protein [Planctomycetota bacterium]